MTTANIPNMNKAESVVTTLGQQSLVVYTTPTLVGANVILRPVKQEDEQARKQLGWHTEIQRGFGKTSETRPMTDEEAHEWYEIRQRELDPTSMRRSWIIEAQGTLVGVVFLTVLNETDRKAHYAISMYSPQYMGQGYGTETTKLILAHAFNTMGLHRIQVVVYDFNTASIAMNYKCGFTEEGRQRESCWLNNQWHDDIMMSILSSEFNTHLP